MFNTPEFWVGISFLICCGIFYRLILPKLKEVLTFKQQEIERLFSDAEAILAAAEKKFSRTQERMDALPMVVAEMEKEFDSKVNHLLAEWAAQKDRLTAQYHIATQRQLQHLTDHTRGRLFDIIIEGSFNVLKVFFSKHVDAKAQQQLVIHSLDILKPL